MATPIDNNTGLPKLPAGYYWHVADNAKYDDSDPYKTNTPGIRVYLREETTKIVWFKRVPSYSNVSDLYITWSSITEAGLTVEQAIFRLAEEVYEKRKEYLPQWSEYSEQLESYLGDYPPNNLNKI